MAEVIKLPRMSDTMTEGKIVEWHKQVGDNIKSGDVLADVETDKATMELENYEDGVLLHIGVEKGKSVKVDGLIAIIGQKGEDFSNLLNDDPPPKAQTNTEREKESSKLTANEQKVDTSSINAQVIRLPLLSDTMTEGKIVKWHKKVGDDVGSDDVLADVETDKAVMEVVGYTEGTLLHVGVDEQESAKVNQIIAIVGEKGTDIKPLLDQDNLNANAELEVKDDKKEESKEIVHTDQSSPVSQQAVETYSFSSNGRIKASPLAKKLALNNEIDLKLVKGSGVGGRVIKRDIENAIKNNVGKAKMPTTNVFGAESYEDIPLQQMRQTIAKRLSQSKFTSPHFYLRVSVDMTESITTRAKLNDIPNVKISFNDLIVKACAVALKKHPEINSSWHDDYIRRYNHVNIGVAVAIDNGLVVPVIKQADLKSLETISLETKELAQKARDKKLSLQEMEGSTFSISNLGMFNIDDFTAIINPPNACILAVGAIKDVPVVKNGFVVPGKVMKITLSSDHRIVDGSIGATFINSVKNYLETPASMLL